MKASTVTPAGALASARSSRAALSALPWILLALFALGGCKTSDPSPRAPARLALVIGNAAYANAQPLKNPVNDADDMCAALSRVGFITLCRNNVRTRQEFSSHVDEFVSSLGPNTVGVVYYAGHGVQVGGANFLVPTQGQPIGAVPNPTSALYGVDELFERLRERPARLNIIMLDACRTELFEDAARPEAKRVTPAPAARPDTTGSRLMRELKSLPRSGSGLAAVRDAPPRTVVFYATAAKSAAIDGNGRNGPLTKHILEHIGRRGQTLDKFIEKVTEGVENETLLDIGKRQSPATYRTFAGRFCFVGCEPTEVVPIN